jgi:hypothetical protein
MKSWKSLIVLTALVLVLPLAAHAQRHSAPLLGTWAVDAAKSKYDPGPAPKSSAASTWTFAQTPDGIQLSITANGQTHLVSTFKLDGKPYPMHGGSGIDAHALTPASRLETKSNLMRGGQIAGHATLVVSSNLKTLTIDETYTTPAGPSVHDVIVFDRQ